MTLMITSNAAMFLVINGTLEMILIKPKMGKLQV
jgi:hypothetical protein